MTATVLAFLSLLSSASIAQEVKFKDPDLFCAVEQFSPGLNQAPTAAYAKCAALKDAKEAPSKSLVECKDKAVERAKSCLTKAGVTKVAVKGKFTEKFDIRSQSTNFTCEVDQAGGVNCP
jgi:hypothetical protein